MRLELGALNKLSPAPDRDGTHSGYSGRPGLITELFLNPSWPLATVHASPFVRSKVKTCVFRRGAIIELGYFGSNWAYMHVLLVLLKYFNTP